MNKRTRLFALLTALVLLPGLLAGCGNHEEPSDDKSSKSSSDVWEVIPGAEEPDDMTGLELPDHGGLGEPDIEMITWSLDGGVLTIAGTGDMENYSSTESTPWVNELESIYSIVIEPGVTSIGDYAFSNCSSLTSVTIPDSVISIGDYALGWCTSLTSVTVPDSVTFIGAGAFTWCDTLTSVTISGRVTSISDLAFAMCTRLTSVTIPDGVTSIGDSAFDHCYSLASVTIPDSVTSIGECAFMLCESLTDVYYNGTQAQFDAISVGMRNDELLNAAIHYGG